MDTKYRIINVLVAVTLSLSTLIFAQIDTIRREDKAKIAELLSHVRSAVQLQDAKLLTSRIYVDSTKNTVQGQLEKNSLQSGLDAMFNFAATRSFSASTAIQNKNTNLTSTYDFEVRMKDFKYKGNGSNRGTPNQAELLLEIGFKYSYEDSTYLKDIKATSLKRFSDQEATRLLKYRPIKLELVKDRGFWWIESLSEFDNFFRNSFKKIEKD